MRFFYLPLLTIIDLIVIIQLIFADVAELADAHGSGPCESNFVQVQVLSSASRRQSASEIRASIMGAFFFRNGILAVLSGLDSYTDKTNKGTFNSYKKRLCKNTPKMPYLNHLNIIDKKLLKSLLYALILPLNCYAWFLFTSWQANDVNNSSFNCKIYLHMMLIF